MPDMNITQAIEALRSNPSPEDLSAIADKLEGVGWQPIESAPHGVLVLLYCPDRGCPTNRARVELDYASHGQRVGNSSSISHHSWATHWMPLPQPPKER